jgi:hypothetical protein
MLGCSPCLEFQNQRKLRKLLITTTTTIIDASGGGGGGGGGDVTFTRAIFNCSYVYFNALSSIIRQ